MKQHHNLKLTKQLNELQPIELKPLSKQKKWLLWLPATMLVLGLTSCFEPVRGKMPSPRPTDKIALRDTAQRTFSRSAVQMNAEFPGGEDAFNNFLGQHLGNPSKITGQMVVTFMIEKDGSLTDIKIVKSVAKSLDEEVINTIKQSPRWKPGMLNGKVLRTKFTLPVDFMGDAKPDQDQ